MHKYARLHVSRNELASFFSDINSQHHPKVEGEEGVLAWLSHVRYESSQLSPEGGHGGRGNLGGLIMSNPQFGSRGTVRGGIDARPAGRWVAGFIGSRDGLGSGSGSESCGLASQRT